MILFQIPCFLNDSCYKYLGDSIKGSFTNLAEEIGYLQEYFGSIRKILTFTDLRIINYTSTEHNLKKKNFFQNMFTDFGDFLDVT